MSLASTGRRAGTWMALAGLCLGLTAAESSALDPLRRVTLEDAFVLQEYRAGKASFVESPERHAGVWTGTGFRYPLLALEGRGSLRHIWTTRGDGDPYFDWECFVDGETTPSVRFTDESMVRAAAAYPVPVAPANALPVHNRAFNFFLPVPFERSLRVEVVQRQPSFWLWFCQLDYRLEDDSLRGVRLFSEGEGENLAFSYVGLPHQLRERPASRLPREQVVFEPRQLGPGASATLRPAHRPRHCAGTAVALVGRWPSPAQGAFRRRVVVRGRRPGGPLLRSI
ncbi:MAG: hypothetical protein M5U12_02735 [Verrucomicrobia bacterium]|nr:hypothetical protein [Verrucomicrobiota bacterium]